MKNFNHFRFSSEKIYHSPDTNLAVNEGSLRLTNFSKMPDFRDLLKLVLPFQVLKLISKTEIGHAVKNFEFQTLLKEIVCRVSRKIMQKFVTFL